jgi:hypothetical protein
MLMVLKTDSGCYTLAILNIDLLSLCRLTMLHLIGVRGGGSCPQIVGQTRPVGQYSPLHSRAILA